MVDQLHKVEEVAPRVGLSKAALYDACRKNQFPHVRIGKRIRIPASALLKWIEAQIGAAGPQDAVSTASQ